MSSSIHGMTRPSGGHSATVRIALHVNGSQVRIAKIGPNRLYFHSAQTLAASTGEVVMHIDGHERRWRVTLRPNVQPSRVVEAVFETE